MSENLTKIAARLIMSDGTSGLEPGLYYTFDEGLVEDCIWSGPFPSAEAALEHAREILEDQARRAVEDFFS